MKKKVLFLGTVYRLHMMVFHLPYMQWFQQQGYEVHLCCRNDTDQPDLQPPFCDRYIDLPFERSPFSPQNLQVYRQLRQLIDQEDYTLIHCNTPVGGMLGRLAARSARKKGTRVVYTAHGFHFFTGAPLKNWLIFYPAERWLSRFTDLLITINREDDERARHFHAPKTAMVSGVGVDLTRFEQPINRAEVRATLGLKEDDRVVICVGEHSVRKNHETVIRAATLVPDCHVLFCGVGEKQLELESLTRQLNMTERVHFLGFCRNIPQMLMASDVFVFPSWQEGLPVAQMEAMAAGLPCVVSDVRGNRDLIAQGDGGYLCRPDDVEGFAKGIQTLLSDPALCQSMGERNRREMQKYSLQAVLNEMSALYRQELEGL